jgi:formylglycine-generating enzyme required for sulfatase activity
VPSAEGIRLAPGSRPLSEYQLVRLLGKGGYGEVWQAKGPGGFSVALKFVRLGEQAGEVELRALELMKGIRHANLLHLSGAWQRDGWLIIAMELAERTLLQRLREVRAQGHPGIPAPELLEYMFEAAKGLDYLNEWRDPSGGGEAVGIQHKDVKPENLLLVGGAVKVADFGLAKLLEHTVTQATGLLTPAYAAPEFFRGQATRWSDQYCLAVTYCQLRGGQLPFGGDYHQVLAGHLMEPPDLAMLPETERPVVARALSKKPEQRWPSFREFVQALQAATSYPLAAGSGRSTAPSAASAAASILAAPTEAVGQAPIPQQQKGTKAPSPVPGRQQEQSRLGGRALFWLALVLLLALGVVGGWLWLSRMPKPLDCTGKDGVSPGEVRLTQEAWAKQLGRQVEETIEIADGVKMTFVLVPPGKFRMGSPEGEKDRGTDETLHEVTLTEPFDLGKTEVTQAQYEALTGKNPSKFKRADQPVETVSWDKARDFAAQLTKKRDDQHLYRLPSEAEWEYACRGGRPSSQPFGIGDGRALSSREANFNGNHPYGGVDTGECLQSTCRVSSCKANALGLLDMHGNVWEWCADWYAPYPAGGVANPTGPAEGSARVIRGGSWLSDGSDCRASNRDWIVPSIRGYDLGFRLLRSVPTGDR